MDQPVGKLKYTDSGWEGGFRWGYLHDERGKCFMISSKDECLKRMTEHNLKLASPEEKKRD